MTAERSYLVLAAMTVEAEELLRRDFGDVDVTVSLTGIGKVAAASTCARLLAERPRDEVIVAGISGALTPDLRIGDVVVGDAAVQHDLDVRPLVDAPGVVPELGIARFPAAADRTERLAAAAGDGARRGLVVSGDQIIRSEAQRAAILEWFPDALAVDMETAAIAQVCHLAQVPWAVVRVISDAADEHLDPGEILAFAAETAGMVADVVSEALRP